MPEYLEASRPTASSDVEATAKEIFSELMTKFSHVEQNMIIKMVVGAILEERDSKTKQLQEEVASIQASIKVLINGLGG